MAKKKQPQPAKCSQRHVFILCPDPKLSEQQTLSRKENNGGVEILAMTPGGLRMCRKFDRSWMGQKLQRVDGGRP